jgi:MFS family permease
MNNPPTATDPGPDTPGSPQPANQAALLIVWLVVFIDLLGFGIVLPVMPRQAEPYLAGYSSGAKGAVIGILFSSFSLMQFVFSPVWGRVSDRIGRRPVLLISLLGSVVFYALYGYAVTLPADAGLAAIGLMLLARVGAGIAGASVGTAAAVIADCTPPEQRAKGMALIGIAFGAGFTVGPLIAYFGLELFDQKPWGVGVLASGLSAAALLLAVAIFKETRNPSNKAGKDFFSLSRTAEVLQMPAVGTLILIYFLAIFAFANFEATLALFTESSFGMTNRDNFLAFAYVGAVLMLAGGAYRPLAKRESEVLLLRVGHALMIVGLAMLAMVAIVVYAQRTGGREIQVTPLKTCFYVAISVSVVGFAFVNPSVSALVSKGADPARQGEVLGVNQAFASLGRILGPFLGSVLFQADPSRTLPYATAVVVLLLVGRLLMRISKDEGSVHHRGTETTEQPRAEKAED